MNNKNKRIINFFQIQVLVMLYSCVSVMSKVSSNEMKKFGVISKEFIFCIFIMLLILAIYAIFWQKVIKKVEISTAYLNKSTSLFWSLLWSYLIFGENIHISQVVGLIIIFIGIRGIYLYGD